MKRRQDHGLAVLFKTFMGSSLIFNSKEVSAQRSNQWMLASKGTGYRRKYGRKEGIILGKQGECAGDLCAPRAGRHNIGPV